MLYVYVKVSLVPMHSSMDLYRTDFRLQSKVTQTARTLCPLALSCIYYNYYDYKGGRTPQPPNLSLKGYCDWICSSSKVHVSHTPLLSVSKEWGNELKVPQTFNFNGGR